MLMDYSNCCLLGGKNPFDHLETQFSKGKQHLRKLFSKIDIHIAYKYTDKCYNNNKMRSFCSRK